MKKDSLTLPHHSNFLIVLFSVLNTFQKLDLFPKLMPEEEEIRNILVIMKNSS